MKKSALFQKMKDFYIRVNTKVRNLLGFWTPTFINFLLKKVSRKTQINPKLLFTENRKDVEYRISFLKDVIVNKVDPAKTHYYQFILKLNPSNNPDKLCKKFINLYYSVKNCGLKYPIYVLESSKPVIRARYFSNGKKCWKRYENKTKFQIFDGAHRVAIAIFEGYDKIPCKIFKPVNFEIPDYTGYINCSERVYDILIKRPDLMRLHKSLNRSLSKYSEQFGRGGFYQGLESICIEGQRPTEERFRVYEIRKYLKKHQKVLDIGSNCGFFSLYLSQFVDSVEGIEKNQNMLEIANKVREYLNIKNCTFYNGNFEGFSSEKKYDIILSLAIHKWISLEFDEYLRKIYSLLKSGGLLLLESHKIEEGDSDFNKNVRRICKGKFIFEKEGFINDDGIIKRKFIILKKI